SKPGHSDARARVGSRAWGRAPPVWVTRSKRGHSDARPVGARARSRRLWAPALRDAVWSNGPKLGKLRTTHLGSWAQRPAFSARLGEATHVGSSLALALALSV